MITALTSFLVLFGLLILRMPIALALLMTGIGGYAYIVNWKATIGMIGTVLWDFSFSYSLSAIPLFVLMGNLVARSGIADDLFLAAEAYLKKTRGGLAIATVFSCAGFGAICGSSAATAATMAKVAIPPMRKLGYKDELSSATVAAGGTLGILIPPSILLLTYGVFTQTHIGKLFAAGLIPGIVGALGYVIAIKLSVWRKPHLVPAPDVGRAGGASEKFHKLIRIWPVIVLFLLVMGGIYGGFMTSTEASGVGAFGAFVLAASRRGFTMRAMFEVLIDSGKLSAIIFAIILGAGCFAEFLNQSGIHVTLTQMITGAGIPSYGVILIIIGIYIVLGCVLESVALVLLTIPLFFPVIVALGYDPVWFGILLVIVTELGLITPPIGLNLFIIQAAMPGVSLRTIITGIVPFIALDIVRVMLIAFVPVISLWLPGILFP